MVDRTPSNMTPTTPRRTQLDMLGTPMPAKTPLNLQGRLMEMKKANQHAQTQLYMAAGVSLFFIIAQLIGGWMAGSIAILTDSAHLASDLIGFALSIISLKIAEKKPDDKHSFGYHRAEIIGSVVSLSSIWIMTVFLVMAAFQRFFMPPQVNSNLMLPISIMGLIFNLIQMKILHQEEPETIQDAMAADKVNDPSLKESMLNEGQAHPSAAADAPARNINVDSAYLHVLGDMLMSLGVITAATIIYFRPDLWWFDPICTFAFALMILVTSYPTLKSCVDVMMEGVPESIDAAQLEQDIWE